MEILFGIIVGAIVSFVGSQQLYTHKCDNGQEVWMAKGFYECHKVANTDEYAHKIKMEIPK